MKLKIILMIVFWVLMYIFIFRLFPYFNDKYSGCYVHHDVYIQNIKSIVEKKFIDSSNHYNKTIVYLNEDKLKRGMIFPGYLEDMYDYLNIGDSIVKEKNSIYYRVKSKATGKDTLFKFETTCKDSLTKSH